MKAIVAAAAIFCIAMIGIAYYFTTRTDTTPRTIPLSSDYENRIKDGGWIRGNKDATVTVIEYADLQCPACQAVNPLMNEAFEATKDIARFSFRHYPLPMHNKSTQAAIAAEAAGRQGKFWELEEILYNQQSQWEAQGSTQFATTLEGYVKSLSLDVTQYKRDINDSRIKDEILKDIANGDKIPVQGTPTILINDKVLESMPASAEQLIAAIRQAATTNANQP